MCGFKQYRHPRPNLLPPRTGNRVCWNRLLNITLTVNLHIRDFCKLLTLPNTRIRVFNQFQTFLTTNLDFLCVFSSSNARLLTFHHRLNHHMLKWRPELAFATNAVRMSRRQSITYLFFHNEHLGRNDLTSHSFNLFSPKNINFQRRIAFRLPQAPTCITPS